MSKEPREQDLYSAALPLTETGNAERLAIKYGHDLLYCHPQKTWLTWTGKRWERDNTGAVERMALETVRSIPVDVNKSYRSFQKKSESHTSLNNMIRLAKSIDGIWILPDQLDQNPWLFNVENGTIDLRTGQLRPHSREDFITKLSPIEFKLDAACQIWDRFLSEIMAGDAELIGFMRRAAGYALTGDVSAHVFFFAHGSGRNGKGTFLRTLRRIAGDYGIQAAPDLLLEKKNPIPIDQADLCGARLAVCSESQEDRNFSEDTLKRLTGGDSIKARFMRENLFEFLPTHKIFLEANHKPRIHGTDLGIWSRIMLIPFEVTFEDNQRDSYLEEKFNPELSGILSWVVKGALEWYGLGGGLKGLAPPERVLKAVQEYRDEEDQVGKWVNDYCFKMPEAFTQTKALYDSYLTWCEKNAETPLGKNRLATRLKSHGYKPYTNGSVRGWRGLQLDPSQNHTPSRSRKMPVDSNVPVEENPWPEPLKS